jgi:hypothetical protein
MMNQGGPALRKSRRSGAQSGRLQKVHAKPAKLAKKTKPFFLARLARLATVYQIKWQKLAIIGKPWQGVSVRP